MSFSGDRSDTRVLWQYRLVSFMSFSGDRSASRPLPQLPPHFSVRSPVNARTGERSVTSSVRNSSPITTPFSMWA